MHVRVYVWDWVKRREDEDKLSLILLQKFSGNEI